MKNIISWFGTVASIAGAFLLPFGYMQIGYICFTLGSISWVYIGIFDKNKSLITLNGTFFCANILGLYRSFF